MSFDTDRNIKMNIARVFPRKTNATPDDLLAFVGMPDINTPDWFDEIHISVAFTYDFDRACMLADVWSKRTDNLKIGGPGAGMKGADFTPGMYLKKGYVITSRGCPNQCYFCSVHGLDGDIRELPITEGWNVLDDNLLACSDSHIIAVFNMLMKCKTKYHQRIQFTGGFEVHRLVDWHIEWILKLRPKQIFFAYDYDNQERLDELRDVSCKMLIAGITKEALRCYVLIGYPGDTLEKAENRLCDVVDTGYIPMAMLYRDKNGNYFGGWSGLQKLWARPAIMRARGII